MNPYTFGALWCVAVAVLIVAWYGWQSHRRAAQIERWMQERARYLEGRRDSLTGVYNPPVWAGKHPPELPGYPR